MLEKMKFKPTQDYILVRPLPRKEKSILEVVNWEKHCRGEIVAVGPGKRHPKTQLPMPMDAKVGQIVAFGDGNFDFYPKWYPSEESDPYRIIQEADICFVDEGTSDVELQRAA